MAVEDTSVDLFPVQWTEPNLPLTETLFGERRTMAQLTAGSSLSVTVDPDTLPGEDDSIAFTFASGSAGIVSVTAFTPPLEIADLTQRESDRFLVSVVDAPAAGVLRLGVADGVFEFGEAEQDFVGPGTYEFLYSDFELAYGFYGFDAIRSVSLIVDVDTPVLATTTYTISDVRTNAIPEPSAFALATGGFWVVAALCGWRRRLRVTSHQKISCPFTSPRGPLTSGREWSNLS